MPKTRIFLLKKFLKFEMQYIATITTAHHKLVIYINNTTKLYIQYINNIQTYIQYRYFQFIQYT